MLLVGADSVIPVVLSVQLGKAVAIRSWVYRRIACDMHML